VSLLQILEICYKSGVHTVTIYAFSIENFKRSKFEVDGLMAMAKIKLKQLVQHGDLLDRYGARVRILGQRELIKPDVLEAVDKAVEMTSHNEGNCVLNICFPYTSREEITTAVKSVVEEWSQPLTAEQAGQNDKKSPFREDRIAESIRSEHSHQNGDDTATAPSRLSPPTLQSPSSSTTSLSDLSSEHDQDHDNSSVSTSTTLHQDDSSSTSSPHAFSPLKSQSQSQTQPSPRPPKYASPELITASTITANTYTASCPPIDLLVRTSGVSRLSDFMLWQCHEDTEIVFLDVLWPEFDLWSFLPVLWEWQWRRRREDKKRDDNTHSTASSMQQRRQEAEGLARKVRVP
jgi:ditrans,polycis-polyprenyl diphosphate synthase